MALSLSTRLRCASVAVCAVQFAFAQDFPVKPVRIITSSAGSGTDFVARQIAPGLSSALGQQVVIDNRTGNFPAEVAAKAPPDGYSLLVGGNTWIAALMQKLPFDMERDFAPVSMLARAPNVLVVHPSLPVKSVKELVALAKARPGELNFGSARSGGGAHLSGELFRHLAKVNIVWVAYRGSSQALTGLMGGEVHMQITDASNVLAHIKSRRLRGLGVTSKDASELAPGMHPISATLPGYEFVGMTGIFAPAKVPAAIINRLNAELGRVLRLPELSQRFLTSGIESFASTPAEFAAKIRLDIETWSKLVKDLNIIAE